MDMWTDFTKKEDLETESGAIDQDKIRLLSMNTYLKHIEDLIGMGANDDPEIAYDHLEDVMTDIFMCTTHAMEDRYPEPEEISEYLKKPENIEALQYWTYISVNADEYNWPALVKSIREELNIPEGVPLKNENRINSEIEKTIKERKWIIREL